MPLYNLVPPAGQPAQFGANILLANSFLDVSVRTGSDYGLTTTSSNISALLPLIEITVALWGVPADPSHDVERTCPGRRDAVLGQCPVDAALDAADVVHGAADDDSAHGLVGHPGQLRD